MTNKSVDELANDYAIRNAACKSDHYCLVEGFEAGHASRDEELKAKDERIAELEFDIINLTLKIANTKIEEQSKESLQSQVQLLEEALKITIKQSEGFGCHEAKEALQKLAEMRGNNG